MHSILRFRSRLLLIRAHLACSKHLCINEHARWNNRKSWLLPSLPLLPSPPYDASSLQRLQTLILPSLYTNGTDFSLCHRPSYSSPCISTRFEFLWTTPRCLVDPLTLLCLTAAPNSNTMISHGFACMTTNMCQWLTHLTPGIVEFQLEIESNLVSLPPESPRSNTRKLDSNCKISSAVHCYFHLQSIFQLFFRSSSSGFNFEDFPLSPLNSLWR